MGGPVKTEEDPLDPHPPASFRQTLAAIRYLEDAVCSAADMEALALRYGMFYGPGTGIAQDGVLVELICKRRFPIVGNGAGVWSFIHIGDAARATVAAITHGSSGIYNVVDDKPAPVAVWLPFLADAVGGTLWYGDNSAVGDDSVLGASLSSRRHWFASRRLLVRSVGWQRAAKLAA